MRSPSPLTPPTARGESERIRVRRARPLLGTRVEITAGRDAGPGGEADDAGALEALHAAVDRAFAAIESVHRAMSYHECASELSRLNRGAWRVPQPIGPHTHRVLEAALRLAGESGGAFDPSVASTLERLGFLPRAAIDDASPVACWRDIELMADGRVRFHRPLRIDLGGIAKGYAVDLATRVLREAGASQIVVNAGGDLRVGGPRPQRVEIRHPDAPGVGAHVISLENAALATSAGYFSGRGSGGGRICALIDPQGHVPYGGPASISVHAPDCMIADALTKVVLFGAPAIAERMLEAHGARAYVLARPLSEGM